MKSKLNIEAKTHTITYLLNEFSNGKYYLPSFQRNYVWDEDDIKDLIDSIIKKYPIGNIILWKNKSRNKMDAFAKPFVDIKSKSDDIYYIIDGQQRLTSLFLLFNNWKMLRDKEQIEREPIRYNPTSNSLHKGRKTKMGIDLSKLIKAYYEFDADSIKELTKQLTRPSNNSVKDMVQNVILQYQIPFYVIETQKTDDEIFSEMAEAFIRVNKNGIRIGNLELMLSFLAGSVSGELKNLISKLYDKLNKDYEIELQPVIRSAFSNFELKQTQISKAKQFKNNIKKISDKYDDKKRKDLFAKSELALNLAIQLLKEGLGLPSARIIPSQTSIVLLSKYFQIRKVKDLKDLTRNEMKNILNWFILVNFNGYYSSHTDTKLDNDMELLKKAKSFPFLRLKKNMEEKKVKTLISLGDLKRGLNKNILRSEGRAYLFLLYAILVKNGADDWNAKLLSQCNFDELAKHHIYPKNYLMNNIETDETEEPEITINNLGNITYINKDINSEIGDDNANYMHKYKVADSKHFIPNGFTKFTVDNYDDFLAKRIILIYKAGKKYFRRIFK